MAFQTAIACLIVIPLKRTGTRRTDACQSSMRSRASAGRVWPARNPRLNCIFQLHVKRCLYARSLQRHRLRHRPRALPKNNPLFITIGHGASASAMGSRAPAVAKGGNTIPNPGKTNHRCTGQLTWESGSAYDSPDGSHHTKSSWPGRWAYCKPGKLWQL